MYFSLLEFEVCCTSALSPSHLVIMFSFFKLVNLHLEPMSILMVGFRDVYE